MSTELQERTYREVTVPIPAENIKEFFTNKNIFFLANHSQSRLKGGVFLTYLSNLAVPSDVIFDKPLTKEEYKQIMQAYLAQRNVIQAQALQVMMAQILLWAKGLNYQDIPYQTDIPEEYIREFAKENVAVLMNWLHFLDSSTVFATSAIGKLNEKYLPKENFELIEDKEYVGHNVVSMYSVPYFTEFYFGIENAQYRESYFVHQFEDYMFGNKRLAEYFAVDNNFIHLAFVGMVQGVIDPNNIQAFLESDPKDVKHVATASEN